MAKWFGISTGVSVIQRPGAHHGRAGSSLQGSTPENLYPAADGGFVAMAASSDAVFRRLAGADAVESLRTIAHMSEDKSKALLDSGAAFDLTHARGLPPHPKENTE